MIINISGLPGSGKSTLAENLAKELGYKLFKIDHYRNKYQDEFLAMINLFLDMKAQKDDFILDSVGFNKRIQWVFSFIPVRVVELKIVCDIDVLKRRLEKKKIPKNDYFPYRKTRGSYIDDYFQDMAHRSSDFVLDSSYLTEDALLRTAMDNLTFYQQKTI